MSVSFVYVLSDPRDGEVRYVGQSIEPRNRLTNHLCEVRAGSDLYCHRWLRQLVAAGVRPEMRVLAEVPREDVNEAERRWVAHFRALGARLTNLTDGGGGLSGYKLSPEHVAALVAANTGKQRSAEARANIKAALNRPETRAKLSEARMGNPSRRGQTQSAEEREKKRVANVGQKRSAEFCEAVRQRVLGTRHSEEAKRKMGETKRLTISPERRSEIAKIGNLARQAKRCLCAKE